MVLPIEDEAIEDEAIAVAFRRHPLLARDDCLYALQATIPDAISAAASTF
jgi:hypothetical protein